MNEDDKLLETLALEARVNEVCFKASQSPEDAAAFLKSLALVAQAQAAQDEHKINNVLNQYE